MPEQRQQDDDGERYAQQPQQCAASEAHDFLLIMGCFLVASLRKKRIHPGNGSTHDQETLSHWRRTKVPQNSSASDH
jgi:hypothetical protein